MSELSTSASKWCKKWTRKPNC